MAEPIHLELFPCVDYFKKLIKSKYNNLYIYDRFQKGSFRNRYVISGANGLINLTAPIAGGREQKRLVSEIEMDTTSNWKTKHWRTIVSCYSKAPFFEYYSAAVHDMLFYQEKRLFNFNYYILINLIKLLNINIYITTSNTDGEESKFLGDEAYHSHSTLENGNWKPTYAQVFEDRFGFQTNLSILDLLFCEGPNSKKLLEESVVY